MAHGTTEYINSCLFFPSASLHSDVLLSIQRYGGKIRAYRTLIKIYFPFSSTFFVCVKYFTVYTREKKIDNRINLKFKWNFPCYTRQQFMIENKQKRNLWKTKFMTTFLINFFSHRKMCSIKLFHCFCSSQTKLFQCEWMETIYFDVYSTHSCWFSAWTLVENKRQRCDSFTWWLSLWTLLYVIHCQSLLIYITTNY